MPVSAYVKANYPTRTPLILAHRAGALLVPENTIQGWIECKALYAPDVWELDIHMSEDDSLVVIHDESVDRTTNGTGLVGEMTFDQISSLDAGFWFTRDSGNTYPWRDKGVRIPTITQVFDSFPSDRFNIEIKDRIPTVADRLVEVLRQKGLENQVVVASVYTEVMDHFREIAPEIATAATEAEVRQLVFLGKIGLGRMVKTPMDVVQVPEYSGSVHVLTGGFLKLCHYKGLDVHVWTVNDAHTMQRLLELGADGIITDRPDVAQRVFKTMGLREPQSPEGE